MKDEIEQLLVKGIEEKELEHFPEADMYFTQAMILAVKEDYPHGVLHGLMNKGAIWKNLASLEDIRTFAGLAKGQFQNAVDYAEVHHMDEEEKVHAAYLLGQAEMLLGNVEEGVHIYEKTYEYYRNHPRSEAHTGDVLRHLGSALVKMGEIEEGTTSMEDALGMIRKFDDPYIFANRVWEAGALLSLAERYEKEDSEKAKQLADEALKLSEEHNLKIRKDQIQHFLKKQQ